MRYGQMDMCAVCAMRYVLCAHRSLLSQFHLIFRVRCISIHSYTNTQLAKIANSESLWLRLPSPSHSTVDVAFQFGDPLRLLYGQITFLNYCFTFNRIFCILLQSKSVFSLMLILYGIRCFTLLLLDVFNVETCSHGHRFLATCIQIPSIPFHLHGAHSIFDAA